MITTRCEIAGSLSGRTATVRGAVDFVCLAATPTFAMMALLTNLHADDASDWLCAAMKNALPLCGAMTLMLHYLDERVPFATLAETDFQLAKPS